MNKLDRQIKNCQIDPPFYKKIRNYIFDLSDVIGQGSFSKVYRARNQITNEIVAIKIVTLDSIKSSKLQELLHSEVDILQKLSHPNVLKCHEIFSSNRNFYIITEICNEGNLWDRLQKQNHFDQLNVQGIIRDIFNGLFYLAKNNILHRDIKAENIFIKNGKAKIADFGFAKIAKEKFKDISVGSPIYMSPEGLNFCTYGPKTDVWAFGILIYELLHGRTPFSFCRTEKELRNALSTPCLRQEINQELSSEIKAVINRCLEYDQGKRIDIYQLGNMPYFLKIQQKQLIKQSQNRNRERIQIYHQRGLQSNNSTKPFIQFNEGLINFNYPQNLVPKVQSIHSNSSINTITNKRNGQDNFEQKVSNNILYQVNSPKENKAVYTQRAVLAQKPHYMLYQMVNFPFKFEILKGKLSYKQCISILHYCRLIFKYLNNLKQSQFSDVLVICKFSKWLMQILNEISKKIQLHQLFFESENPEIREQKLSEVRDEYERKYRIQLCNFILGQKNFSFQQMINQCGNLCHQCNRLLLSHNKNQKHLEFTQMITLIYSTTKILEKCFKTSNYQEFTSFKDIELFLSLKKK